MHRQRLLESIIKDGIAGRVVEVGQDHRVLFRQRLLLDASGSREPPAIRAATTTTAAGTRIFQSLLPPAAGASATCHSAEDDDGLPRRS